MKSIITALLFTLPYTSNAIAEVLTNGYREPLRNAIAGRPLGILNHGARLQVLEQEGDWVRVRVEGWMHRGGLKAIDQATSAAQEEDRHAAINPARLLVPTLLKKGYSGESLNEIIWLDVDFDTTALPKKTRAIKGALVISDLFGDTMMRIYWTINEPLEPGEKYAEKGTNFAYNEFLSHHQWMRFTDIDNMKASFVVSDIIYDDGEKTSWRH